MRTRGRGAGLSLAMLTGVFMGPLPATTAATHERVHTSEQFVFSVDARADDVFPLFGANRERAWAPDWDPRFQWPPTATDREGMVFQVAQGQGTATWVNTAFDPQGGRVQYVYVLPGVVATLITLNVRPRGAVTEVTVRYDRTALSQESDSLVAKMAAQDRRAGPDWAGQITAHLLRPIKSTAPP